MLFRRNFEAFDGTLETENCKWESLKCSFERSGHRLGCHSFHLKVFVCVFVKPRFEVLKILSTFLSYNHFPAKES